jgi:hypothetical protein
VLTKLVSTTSESRISEVRAYISEHQSCCTTPRGFSLVVAAKHLCSGPTRALRRPPTASTYVAEVHTQESDPDQTASAIMICDEFTDEESSSSVPCDPFSVLIFHLGPAETPFRMLTKDSILQLWILVVEGRKKGLSIHTLFHDLAPRVEHLQHPALDL